GAGRSSPGARLLGDGYRRSRGTSSSPASKDFFNRVDIYPARCEKRKAIQDKKRCPRPRELGRGQHHKEEGLGGPYAGARKRLWCHSPRSSREKRTWRRTRSATERRPALATTTWRWTSRACTLPPSTPSTRDRA